MPAPSARELYASGRLDAAIELLGAELRSNPADTQRRTFLFELLSMAGQYDRAEKQLDVLARAGSQAEAGTLLYRAALSAERVREHMFATGDYPSAPAPGPVAGTVDTGDGHKPFLEIEDAEASKLVGECCGLGTDHAVHRGGEQRQLKSVGTEGPGDIDVVRVPRAARRNDRYVVESICASPFLTAADFNFQW